MNTERILVLGAGGWFGTTLLDQLCEHPAANVLAIASTDRLHQVGTRTWQLHTWNRDRIRQFAPTTVVNFAYLTRERFDASNPQEYIDANMALQAQFLEVAQLLSVRTVLTVSSGAAIAYRDDDNPYGRMKATEEQQALDLVTDVRRVVVARAWSVSGPFVRRPRAYAFSDFILQARAGHIHITADRLVYRRYVDVGDFLRVCRVRAAQGWSGVIDSGGPLVEMQELAEQIREVVQPAATVTRAELASDSPSVYASDGIDWDRACQESDVTPRTLEQQIAWSDANLRLGSLK